MHAFVHTYVGSQLLPATSLALVVLLRKCCCNRYSRIDVEQQPDKPTRTSKPKILIINDASQRHHASPITYTVFSSCHYYSILQSLNFTTKQCKTCYAPSQPQKTISHHHPTPSSRDLSNQSRRNPAVPVHTAPSPCCLAPSLHSTSKCARYSGPCGQSHPR